MKVTQRDKMLLVLLAIVFVVALAYILPGFGISSAMDQKSDYEDMLNEQKNTNSILLRDLMKMGVEPVFAERPALAKDRLNSRILKLKKEAARLAGNILEYTQTYGVDEKWIDGLEYRYGVTSDESDILLAYNKSDDVSGEVNGEVTYDDEENGVSYTIKSAERSITYTVADSADADYVVTMHIDGMKVEEMGALLLFLEHLASKGSLLIDGIKYSTMDGTGSVSFVILMTETDGISSYAREIAELENANTEDND